MLLHMAEHERPVTSEELARMMRTNPVVVRRTMALLKAHGLVSSEKGHGGGWTLERKLAQITLGDVYEALGRPELFAIGNRNDQPKCLVEQSVNAALDGALAEAETLLLASLAGVTLAQLNEDLHRRKSRRKGIEHEH